jgi:enoyl-CoA hydratase/carnithine racemase
MRFASRQSALFGNPEIGVGLVPGGGALEWLPRLVGRSRALEIVLSADDFDADIAERYGWVNRTLDDDALDSFVDTLVRRLASFDRETLGAAKAQINRFGTPTSASTTSLKQPSQMSGLSVTVQAARSSHTSPSTTSASSRTT